jgi:hypothetical protein
MDNREILSHFGLNRMSVHCTQHRAVQILEEILSGHRVEETYMPLGRISLRTFSSQLQSA